MKMFLLFVQIVWGKLYQFRYEMFRLGSSIVVLFEAPRGLKFTTKHWNKIKFGEHLLWAVWWITEHMTEYAGSRDYVGNLQSTWRTPHRSTYPTEKQDSDPLVASSVRAFCTQNSQRQGRGLQREGRSPVFKWDVWICVGSTTETAGSLCNPVTRRTQSYACASIRAWFGTGYTTDKVYIDGP